MPPSSPSRTPDNESGPVDNTERHVVSGHVLALAPCGDIRAGGHAVFDPTCGACVAFNSDAPEWTI